MLKTEYVLCCPLPVLYGQLGGMGCYEKAAPYAFGEPVADLLHKWAEYFRSATPPLPRRQSQKSVKSLNSDGSTHLQKIASHLYCGENGLAAQSVFPPANNRKAAPSQRLIAGVTLVF